MKTISASGKRKKAVARATLRLGNGIVRINSQLLNFIQPEFYRQKIEEPLMIAGDVAKKVDISVNVSGGGMNSRAEAARLAIARAFVAYERNLEQPFLSYDRNLLVADSRQKEQRKPNTHGKARSKRQKSYR